MQSEMPQIPVEEITWRNMTPMQRYEIMSKVPRSKSITKTYRACLKYIRVEGVTA